MFYSCGTAIGKCTQHRSDTKFWTYFARFSAKNPHTHTNTTTALHQTDVFGNSRVHIHRRHPLGPQARQTRMRLDEKCAKFTRNKNNDEMQNTPSYITSYTYHIKLWRKKKMKEEIFTFFVVRFECVSCCIALNDHIRFMQAIHTMYGPSTQIHTRDSMHRNWTAKCVCVCERMLGRLGAQCSAVKWNQHHRQQQQQ